MTSFLYYPKSNDSLIDVGNFLYGGMDEAASSKLCAHNPQISRPTGIRQSHSPIIIPGRSGSLCPAPVCGPKEHMRIKSLSHQIGGPATLALASVVDELDVMSFMGDLNTFGGGGVSASTRLSSLMVKDIVEYDKVLKEFEELRNHRATQATLARKNVELKRAFNKMSDSLNMRGNDFLRNNAFKTREVKSVTGKVVRESIPLSSYAEVKKLVNMARIGRVIAPGFILLDGGLRTGKVARMYQKNDPKWQREAVMQSVGFSAGLLAGVAIAFAVSVTPVGLIVGVVAAGTAGVITDKIVTTTTGTIYDWATQ